MCANTRTLINTSLSILVWTKSTSIHRPSLHSNLCYVAGNHLVRSYMRDHMLISFSPSIIYNEMDCAFWTLQKIFTWLSCQVNQPQILRIAMKTTFFSILWLIAIITEKYIKAITSIDALNNPYKNSTNTYLYSKLRFCPYWRGNIRQ